MINKLKKSLNFKNSKIRVSFIVFLALVLSQITLPMSIFAAGPKFNFLPGDHELLRGANASVGETDWHDPVSAKSNDAVAVIVYFHNGIEETVAKNTKIKVELPTQESKTLISKGSLWADNATIVTDNFTINSAQSSLLEYIPGTSQLYLNGSQAPTALPDGVTTAQGINIGNIQGCWEYAGYVIFQVKIKAPGVADLTIDKKVANATTEPGTNNWVAQNTAKPGDVLAYRLYFTNPGTADAKNVKITDALPTNVSYINGSTKLFNNSTSPSGNKLPDTITSSGIVFNLLEPGVTSAGYIVFQAKINPNLGPGNYTLTNQATILGDNIVPKKSSATTLVNISGQADLVITKQVRNVSQNQDNFVEQNTASAGDTLEYKLEFADNGNAQAVNVKLQDVLPNVAGAPLYYLDGSTKLMIYGQDQKDLPDTIINSGVSIGDLNAGKEGYIIFRIRIDKCPNAGQFNLINTGKISADNVSQKQDTAQTKLTVTPPPQPYLNLEKLVKNVSQGEKTWVDSNIAVPGDTLEYYIWFKNVGDGAATELLVKDELPDGVVYVPGSTILHSKGTTTNLSDGITGNGVKVESNLIPGQEGYLTFKVKVNKDIPNQSVLTDLAHIYSDEGNHAKDSATTTISYQEKGKVLAVKTLPSTGGMSTVALILTSSILGSYYYIRTKKELLAEYKKARML